MLQGSIHRHSASLRICCLVCNWPMQQGKKKGYHNKWPWFWSIDYFDYTILLLIRHVLFEEKHKCSPRDSLILVASKMVQLNRFPPCFPPKCPKIKMFINSLICKAPQGGLKRSRVIWYPKRNTLNPSTISFKTILLTDSTGKIWNWESNGKVSAGIDSKKLPCTMFFKSF